MIELAGLLRPDRGEPAHMLLPIDASGLEKWRKGLPSAMRAAAAAQGFAAQLNALLILPGRGDGDFSAVIGVADANALRVWDLAKAAERLPAGTYRLASGTPGQAALGWLLGQYRFDRYAKPAEPIEGRVLITRDAASIAGTLATAEAVALVRDLVNTPAADMGPQQLEEVAGEAAKAFGGKMSVTRGDALAEGYPMIAAVGRAADRACHPRLIEIEWGNARHPRLAIVGKGVSFDSGGLDIKTASGMRLMKKDMGGAAHAIALARLVMASKLQVRLHVLIPAVENAISGNAMRPGDILRSRAGLSVEVHNTDAEGRLILGDALARAGEGQPELIMDFATLTGAARVALGPELPALFTDDDGLADALLKSATAESDPLWRLPLWSGYEDMLKSDIADLANAGDGSFAGAVSAALFLKRFVPPGIAWAHIDTFAWTPADKPGRPKGGEALGLRATWRMLQDRYACARRSP